MPPPVRRFCSRMSRRWKAEATAPVGSGSRTGAGRGHETDRAADARPAESAVPARVLREVLLVVVLGVVELGGRQDLRGDRAEPARGERVLVRGARRLGRSTLGFRAPVDAGAVL